MKFTIHKLDIVDSKQEPDQLNTFIDGNVTNVKKFAPELIITDDNNGGLIVSNSKKTSIHDGIEATSDIVPFLSFLPLIKVVSEMFNEIIEIYQAAEHNKKTCGILLDRVQIADTAVRYFKNRRDENGEFLSVGNLYNLQKLVHVIGKIRKFVGDITQLTGLFKYIQAKSIERDVKKLSNEFDSTIQKIQFFQAFDFNIYAIKTAKENEIIKNDIKELLQYLEDIGSGITDVNQNVSETVIQINALNTAVNQMAQVYSTVQSDVFQCELLEYYDFEEEGEPIENQNVRKFKRRKNGLNDYVALKLVADKDSSDENKASLKRQVTILKKLKECCFIIQLHGLTSFDDRFYLVTEWAEYGNLREYYQKYGPLEVNLKLKFALDIARGLNFLSAVEIIHCDIRAENILISDHETAKIANFKLSRAVSDSTRNQNAALEAIRYCAPEKLSGGKYKYDTKCEVYSFGILLWEIAEEKIPYEKLGENILDIHMQVYFHKYREKLSFGSPLPNEYRELAVKAVHQYHNFRPRFSKIFTILQDLKKNDCGPPPVPKRPDTSDSLKLSDDEVKGIMNIPNFADFDYMTVDEATKQHKLRDGNRESAYKCFEAYAEL
ncbi:7777_t:CDS:2, partial [Funneliformis geosporum]